MEPVKQKVSCAMRDPMGFVSGYESYFFVNFSDLNGEYQETLAGEFLSWDETRQSGFESTVMGRLQERLIFLHSRGDPIVDLAHRVQDDMPFIEARTSVLRHRWARYSGLAVDQTSGYLHNYQRKRGFSYCAVALLLIAKGPDLEWFGNLLPTSLDYRSYAFEVLLKAFLPRWQLIKKYPRTDQVKGDLSWADPFVRALSVAPDKRTDAVAQYMKSWNRLMTPWGWKPSRDETDSLFVQFAFEAALAVCAYDLDDASFRDHPYYPRDLVDYYRANIRNTRDAWRPVGVGADIEIEPPPSAQKLELAKSKSKGLVRWLELASNGDKIAAEAVVEQVGKLRKVKDVSELSCALAENDAGLHADLRDDDTLTNQIDTLLAKRQLDFTLPVAALGDYAAGIGRCADVLLALDEWLSDKPYRLLALDTQDDSWQAVLVARAHGDEFERLSAALGVGLVAPQDAFDV